MRGSCGPFRHGYWLLRSPKWRGQHQRVTLEGAWAICVYERAALDDTVRLSPYFGLRV